MPFVIEIDQRKVAEVGGNANHANIVQNVHEYVGQPKRRKETRERHVVGERGRLAAAPVATQPVHDQVVEDAKDAIRAVG